MQWIRQGVREVKHGGVENPDVHLDGAPENTNEALALAPRHDFRDVEQRASDGRRGQSKTVEAVGCEAVGAPSVPAAHRRGRSLE